ncbi:MAG: type 1 glutamine amidotransferase domain-containing protein [Anaerolineae bacterium]
MAKVLMLIDSEFQDAEALIPYYRMKEAGYRVDLVGPEAGVTYKGKYGYPLTSDLAAAEVNIDDYEAVIIPGGRAPDHMRTVEPMVQLVRDAFARGKVVAAICHAAQVLIEADVVRGKRATCYVSVKTDLKNAGGLYQDREVVVDGNLVTSRVPADLPAFCRETLRLLEQRARG